MIKLLIVFVVFYLSGCSSLKTISETNNGYDISSNIKHNDVLFITTKSSLIQKIVVKDIDNEKKRIIGVAYVSYDSNYFNDDVEESKNDLEEIEIKYDEILDIRIKKISAKKTIGAYLVYVLLTPIVGMLGVIFLL